MGALKALYLRALEIQGFKSFAQKTRLTFDKPVTAIVGPNGSGKSNISDALRWVMGEQSTRALRGGKMEDVIFGGTGKRSPLGFAEVTLVLDNEAGTFPVDTPEVAVTRRFYRSGDSEYYINRTQVRLRDVNELFMDTGLGRDGYSMIGQGRIDEILSRKSSERRDIFEEAAGISRFRYRKEESERRLEHAEENLQRIQDKIGELELQVGPLKKQSEIAKEYLRLRDEAKGLEIGLWLRRLEDLRQKEDAGELALKQAADSLEEEKETLSELYAGGERLQLQLQKKDMEIEALREKLSAREASAAAAESDIAVLREREQNLNENVARVRQELESRQDRGENLDRQRRGAEERVGELEAAARDAEAEIDRRRETLETLADQSGQAARALEEVLRRTEDNTRALGEARERLSATAVLLQEGLQRRDKLTEELSALSETAESYSTLREENDRARKEAQSALDSLRNTRAGYELRLQSRQRKAGETAETKNRAVLDLQTVQGRRKLLEDMEREYQGYSQAVKIVMQEAGRGTLKHVHAPVANLLRVDSEYALAVETALGNGAQDVVVDREEDARAAVDLLKRRQVGRATFQPLNVIRGSLLEEEGLEEEEGFIGLAVDLVRFEPQYTGVMQRFLGKTVVCETLTDAIRIARSYQHRFRLVTLDGQVMNAGGSITGGSAVKTVGSLSRANELQELLRQEKQLIERAKKAEEANVAAVRELEETEYALKVCAGQIRQAEDGCLRLEGEQKQYALLLSAAEERRTALTEELERFDERKTEQENELAELTERARTLEENASVLRKLQEERSAGAEAYRKRREEIALSVESAKGELAAVLSGLEAARESLRNLEEMRRELDGGEELQRQRLEELLRECQSVREAQSARESERQDRLRHTETLRQELRTLSESRMELEARRNRRDREVQERNEAVLSAQNRLADLEQRQTALQLEEQQLTDKLWDTYSLTRTAAKAAAAPEAELQGAQGKLAALKRSITALGNPNLGAIEEYERVNERYQYLTDQRDDANRAKEEIRGILNDITGQMRRIFAEEFERISTAFSQTFTELFGGGRAELTLEDPEDILNCGIEIHVQPPGKTLKVLSLLSGGERAFVAIALYFAILRIRPTPFVVMDEIESALDEVNVARFAAFTRTMTEHTQFLLITHRRGTMEGADELYGVTMQEQGVSRVLHVDLEQARREYAKQEREKA